MSSHSSRTLVVGLIALLIGCAIGYTFNQDTPGDNSQEILQLENTISQLQSEKTSYIAQISTLENRITSLENQQSETGLDCNDLDELSNIMSEIWVTQHYEWDYYGYSWTLDQSIYLPSYLYYYSLDRPHLDEWASMCLDEYDDLLIEDIVNNFQDLSDEEGFTEYEQVMFIVSFVQHLPYTQDDVTKQRNEYPRFPIETLFDRGGDCEDTSILVASLLYEMGYDVALIDLINENHIAVGIAGGEGIYGTYYEMDDVEYYYLETTGENWDLGEIPDDFSDTTAEIYRLNDVT